MPFPIVYYVTLEDLDAHNNRELKLGSEIDAYYTAIGPNPNHPLGIHPVWMDWRAHAGKWGIWYTAHRNLWDRMGDDEYAEFVALEQQWQELRDRFVADGGATVTDNPPPATISQTIEKWRWPAIGIAALFGVGYVLRGARRAR